MPLRTGQPNFSKGEIAEDLVARVDVAAYSTALRRARNVTILKYGGVTKRPGTRLVAEVYDATKPVRLVPFQFSLTQTYVLEMGQGYMRPAANGGLVVEDRLTIEALVLGLNTQVTSAYHAYQVGDQIYYDGLLGSVEMNGRIGRVVSVQSDSVYTVDIDSRTFSPFTADSGGTPRTGTPAPAPTPPVVPMPTPTPTPPPVSGGGYGGGGGGGINCVVDTTMILLADGSECQACECRVGTMLRTRHAETLEWGNYPVEAIILAFEPVLKVTIGSATIRATADHRFWINGAWTAMRSIGVADGSAWVAKITVTDAHTYVSAGVLSHNIKQNEYQ